MRWFVLNCQSLCYEVRMFKKEQVEFQCFKLWIKFKAMETFLGNSSATNVSAELKWIYRKIFFQMASYRWEIAYRAYLRKNIAENQTPGKLKITKKTGNKRRTLGKSSSTAERNFGGIPSSLFIQLSKQRKLKQVGDWKPYLPPNGFTFRTVSVAKMNQFRGWKFIRSTN